MSGSVVKDAIESEAFKPDTIQKLATAGTLETHLFVFVGVLNSRVWTPLAHLGVPLERPMLPPEVSHVWMAGSGAGCGYLREERRYRRCHPAGMPIISVFFGIVVRMYYREHEPAHFHAEYQSQQGKFDFSGEMTVGNIQSRTALRLIKEWAVHQRSELEGNWERMKAGRPLNGIAPLE
jgi:hypothetical protein